MNTASRAGYRRAVVLVLAAIVALLAVATANTITHVSALRDEAATRRTPSTSISTFAFSPSGILGVDGYYLPGAQGG